MGRTGPLLESRLQQVCPACQSAGVCKGRETQIKEKTIQGRAGRPAFPEVGKMRKTCFGSQSFEWKYLRSRPFRDLDGVGGRNKTVEGER